MWYNNAWMIHMDEKSYFHSDTKKKNNHFQYIDLHIPNKLYWRSPFLAKSLLQLIKTLKLKLKLKNQSELDPKACKSLLVFVSPLLPRDGISDSVSIICDRECVWQTTGPGRGQPRDTASQYSPLIGQLRPLLSRVRSEYLGRSSHWVSYITLVCHTGDFSSGTFYHLFLAQNTFKSDWVG